MALAYRATAHELGRRFAEAVGGEPAVRGLWVTSHRDYVELWLVTESTDADTERRLYGLVSRLYERSPDANVRLYVISPDMFQGQAIDSVIPRRAEEIPLSAS
jgi:hypothetical protein